MKATEIDKIGYHGITTYALSLEDVRVPPEACLGDDGLATTLSWLNVARVHTAARAVGLARSSAGSSPAPKR